MLIFIKAYSRWLDIFASYNTKSQTAIFVLPEVFNSFGYQKIIVSNIDPSTSFNVFAKKEIFVICSVNTLLTTNKRTGRGICLKTFKERTKLFVELPKRSTGRSTSEIRIGLAQQKPRQTHNRGSRDKTFYEDEEVWMKIWVKDPLEGKLFNKEYHIHNLVDLWCIYTNENI